MASLITFFLALLAALPLISADQSPYGVEDAEDYDRGKYGGAPEEKFHTVDVPAYRMLRRTWDEERCASDDKFFLGIRGRRLWHTGPVIHDNEGHQVWYTEGFRTPYNFRTQWYQGEQYLTWWAGDDEGGHGSGYYYMYDKHYQEYRRISAHGNHSADLHEFLITPQGTALLTVYDRIPADLSQFGIKQEPESYIYDSLFQEIDLETNELLFEWRASDHFSFDDCFSLRPNISRAMPLPPSSHPINSSSSPLRPTRKPRAWDWFHINSVAKDTHGNYLISSRYSHSLTYISGADGRILWQLGGRNNSFTDVSAPPYSGYSTSLAWQHHVQLLSEDPLTVLIFDNQAVNWEKTHPARVLKIRLDTVAMTAEVVAAAEHPREYIVPSQGSVQQLPSGNLFVGYGFASAMTEFSADGKEVLCDWQYGALHAKQDGAYSAGMIQSYRAFKQPWKGWPKEVPKVKIGEVVVHSNGTVDEGIEKHRTSRPVSGVARRFSSISRVFPREEEEAQEHAQFLYDENGGEDDHVLSRRTKMWISWNGATEVKSWVLERRLRARELQEQSSDVDSSNKGQTAQYADTILERHSSASSFPTEVEDSKLNATGWSVVQAIPKAGFESSIDVPIFDELLEALDENVYAAWQVLKNRTEYRLRALDVNNDLLGLWHITHDNVVVPLPISRDTLGSGTWSVFGHLSLTLGHASEGHSVRYTLAWMLALAICMLGVLWMHKRKAVKHTQESTSLGPYADDDDVEDDERDEESGALIRKKRDRASSDTELEHWHEPVRLSEHTIS